MELLPRDPMAMEVKEMLDREGRDAKNLLVYQFCAEPKADDKSAATFRKPPRSPKSPNHSLAAPATPKNRPHSPGDMSRSGSKQTSGPRVRSASTGRDKKSELQARYWALLFGNLQRAVNEIYQTVECYENISSCQEAILVLENYVRDFKALSEWFKVSWDYEATPQPQRPHSLAWEVRKSNPVPRVRAKSLSSPTQASGMSSPCYSGKTSPCCNIDGLSPRKGFRAYEPVPKAAMRVNVRELFASSKRQVSDSGASPSQTPSWIMPPAEVADLPLEQVPEPEVLLNKRHQYAQTDLEDENLTLAEIREKMRLQEEWPPISDHQLPPTPDSNETLTPESESNFAIVREPTALEMTVQKLNAMENEILAKDAAKAPTPQTAEVKKVEPVKEIVKESVKEPKKESQKEPKKEPVKDPKKEAVKENKKEPVKETKKDSVKETKKEPVKETKKDSVKETKKEPVKETAKETKKESKKEPVKESVKEPIKEPAKESTKEPDKESTKESAKENIKLAQPAIEEKKAESIVVPKPAAPPPSNAELVKKPATSLTTGGAQNSPLKYSSVLNRLAATNTRTTAKVSSARAASGSAAVAPTNSKPAVLTKTASNSSLRRWTAASGSAPTSTFAKPTPASARNPRNVNSIPARPASKTEMYGAPTNVSSRMSARSRTMFDMSSNGPKAQVLANVPKPSLRLSSSRKSSREDIGSSSSTLKATSNERITSSRSSLHQMNNGIDERRSEPKQMPTNNTNSNNNDSNDGWLTVKNRRRSSLHWANRFNQPTGYASLPTLALLNEKREEEHQRNIKAAAAVAASKSERAGNREKHSEERTVKRPEIKNAKAKVNSLPVQRKHSLPANKQQSSVSSSSSSATTRPVVPSRQTIIKRQKSDLTGLKMTSLHKEYMRSEKYARQKRNAAEAKLNNSAETSSADTVIEADTHTQATNSPDSESVEQNKIDIKIQTNREFSKTIGDLYDSISLTAKSSTLTNGAGGDDAGTLSSCDENEETLASEMECDEDQRMLVEEQESLERQIRELESTEIDVDTETDETDCEANTAGRLHDEDEFDDISSIVFVTGNDEDNTNLSLELRYQALLSDMSWGEREEALATLQAYVSRHPGRAQELHQKLSSPSRRRSLQETLKKYQAKQARAQQKRELLQKEKAIKIQQLLARVEDVKSAKQQLIEDKRLKMEGRLQRAAENRTQYLKQIIEKAHDEEKKLKEINFIKNIEAQNKRLDLIESSKDAEGRLQDLEQERQKRLEEKAAKEAAVERRRQELEKERQRKLEKMNETRIEKEQRIGKMQEQKERQRQALAREKARDREERLLALQAQQQQTTEELQRKILQKQKESARRHEENIEHIRQRALELAIPTRNVDENGRCENGTEAGVGGEDGDLSSTVSDVGSREHTRGYKKKMKKLKQRMAQGAEEYMKELQPVPLHMKRESQVPKFLNLISKGGGALGLERPLGQLMRLMAKAQVFDFQCFLLMDGLGVIATNVIVNGMQENSEVSKKAVVLAVQLYRNACTLCPQIARHALLGNSIVTLFDALFQSLQLPEEKSPQHPVELSTELMLACTVALSPSYAKKHTHPKVLERLPDLISYAVTIGLIEILSRRCMKIRESIESHQSVVLSLLATLGFLTRFIDICPPGPADTTRFLNAAKSTELFGSISMLYASVVPIGECIPPKTTSLAASTFNLLVSMAVLDLATFQEVMADEALALKFLDVVTILLKYCGSNSPVGKTNETQAVIIDLIATIGFFCANNRKNQDLLTSEQCTIIIKSLTKLPEPFHCVVYPCLLTITFQNEAARSVIGRDFNLNFLDGYSKSQKAKSNHLVALLREKT